ncbi:MAG TPA: gliding motility-associated ABC transporter substrate-binding protein GldG [Flavitalea sp.]|nr:gliding motility-associated ABC transporter substrate-binding protein GldG [Flavitalea sp.]
MNKLLSSKYWWIYLLIILVGINYLASQFHYRMDLTAEKRYTLSEPTKKLLRNLSDRVSVTFFLDGEMPAPFKNLSNETKELLQEFRELGKSNIQLKFGRPGEGMNDTARVEFINYLTDSLGLKPTNVQVQASAGESQEERLVYPGALISYKDNEIAVNLLEGQSMTGGYQTLNNAEALLEYRFANAIQKITTDTVPVIGYLLGNGESYSYNVYDLITNTLKPRYGFGWAPIDSFAVIPKDFDALMIVKPTIPFNDNQKLKIDQYVMNGGKIIWLMDQLYAEMDSLVRSESDFVAFDRGLNADDLLFKYGVRINQDLVQDIKCDKLPQVVGNLGNKPQVELIPWPYFPLLSSYSNHPISKNLDDVLSIFPNSIDTVKTEGIKKTVLLATSSASRSLSTPAIVTLNSAKTREEVSTFNRKNIPIAVLLEGQFSSLYANRLGKAKADSLSAAGQPFRSSSGPGNKMIVISDADIVSNVVTQKDGPLSMGENQFTQYKYANQDFILNCIEYLTNPSGILEARAKDYTLRLLDPKKVDSSKTQWQFMNIVIPMAVVMLFGLIYQFIRRRKYQ